MLECTLLADGYFCFDRQFFIRQEKTLREAFNRVVLCQEKITL